jgi:hypothetical protein
MLRQGVAALCASYPVTRGPSAPPRLLTMLVIPMVAVRSLGGTMPVATQQRVEAL